MNANLAVLMSVYSGDNLYFIKKAISSILLQSYSNFNFFILVDGPVSEEIITHLESLDDSRIKLVKNHNNSGLASSMNYLLTTINLEQFEYIARMDADDISHPERFSKQIIFLRENENVNCVGTWAYEIDSFENFIFEKKMPIDHYSCFSLFKKRDCLIHPTVMFKTNYFKKAGLYPTDTYFGEDTVMWLNGFKNNCVFANVPEFLFYFRQDANFFERRRGVKHAVSIWKLRKKVIDELNFSKFYYVFAFLYFLIKLSPPFLIRFFYKKGRNI